MAIEPIDRRQAVQLAAAAAATIAVIDLVGDGKGASASVPASRVQRIRIDGRWRPVTGAWHAQNIAPHPDLARRNHGELERERARLLKLSEDDRVRRSPGVRYRDADEVRLQAVTRVINAHNATRLFLASRSLDEFGFAGVDQLHGNRQNAPCGCVLNFAFDHHLAQNWKPGDAAIVHHPHFPDRLCARHAHLEGDFRRHFWAVRAESA
jgi:hypothetical protein